MDTDHPVFQVAAPEYIDSPFDELMERIAERWVKVRDLGRPDALKIVREEAMRKFSVKANTGSAEPRHIIAVLALVIDSAAPLVELDVVAYCYGLLGRGEESMDSIAARHGITRQAFSNRVRDTSKALRIQPRGGMRPNDQCRIYADVHRLRHALLNRFRPKPTLAKS